MFKSHAGTDEKHDINFHWPGIRYTCLPIFIKTSASFESVHCSVSTEKGKTMLVYMFFKYLSRKKNIFVRIYSLEI